MSKMPFQNPRILESGHSIDGDRPGFGGRSDIDGSWERFREKCSVRWMLHSIEVVDDEQFELDQLCALAFVMVGVYVSHC